MAAFEPAAVAMGPRQFVGRQQSRDNSLCPESAPPLVPGGVATHGYYPRYRPYYAYGATSYYSYGPPTITGDLVTGSDYGAYYGGYASYPYYGPRYCGGGFGFYGPRVGIRIGW